jgi:hypothetical protein
MAARELLYFPIVHSQADMGALNESIHKVTLQKLGERGWRRKVGLIDQFWIDIESALANLAVSYEKARVYQDGLPVCGQEIEIITDLAKNGSPNHRLLIKLMKRGATIMGTESSALLIEEYHLMKKVLESGNVRDAFHIEADQKTAGDALLTKRDRYIADRINQTLQQGETGILFLGMLHKIADRLPGDIHLSYPINRPLDKRGY